MMFTPEIILWLFYEVVNSNIVQYVDSNSSLEVNKTIKHIESRECQRLRRYTTKNIENKKY